MQNNNLPEAERCLGDPTAHLFYSYFQSEGKQTFRQSSRIFLVSVKDVYSEQTIERREWAMCVMPSNLSSLCPSAAGARMQMFTEQEVKCELLVHK